MSGYERNRRDEVGPNSAGQSGGLQQLPDSPDANSESVEELVEEGNAFEAEAVDGAENAAEADVSEVKTRQVKVDDVPQEYWDNEKRTA